MCSARGRTDGARTGVEVVEAAEYGRVELADAGGVARGALAGLPVALHSSQQCHLNDHHQEKGQGVVDDAPGDRKIVECAAVQHLRARLEPGPALDRCAVGLQQ